MCSTERIAQYIIRFNKFAAYTGWGDAALQSSFYSGLPDRLKDELVHSRYPRTLAGVRDASQTIDHRYWRREEEKCRDSWNSGNSSSSTPKTQQQQSSTRTTSTTTTTKATVQKPKSTSSSSSASSSATPRPYADKLGTDGHVLEEEHERRKRLGLCSYCGGAGHIAKDCKKRPIARARAAEVSEATIDEVSDESSEESKN